MINLIMDITNSISIFQFESFLLENIESWECFENEIYK